MNVVDSSVWIAHLRDMQIPAVLEVLQRAPDGARRPSLQRRRGAFLWASGPARLALTP
jgi:hypothetical protein